MYPEVVVVVEKGGNMEKSYPLDFQLNTKDKHFFYGDVQSGKSFIFDFVCVCVFVGQSLQKKYSAYFDKQLK